MEAPVFPEGRNAACWPVSRELHSSPRVTLLLVPRRGASLVRGTHVPSWEGEKVQACMLPGSTQAFCFLPTAAETVSKCVCNGDTRGAPGTGRKHPSPPCAQHTSALLAEFVPSGGNIWSVTVTCQQTKNSPPSVSCNGRNSGWPLFCWLIGWPEGATDTDSHGAQGADLWRPPTCTQSLWGCWLLLCVTCGIISLITHNNPTRQGVVTIPLYR